MSREQLSAAAKQTRQGKSFQWPEFLSLGPGAFIGPWNPPDYRNLAAWMVERAGHYGCRLEVTVQESTNEAGSVEFRSGRHLERRQWRRLGRAYQAVGRAFRNIVEKGGLGLELEQLEPRREVFEWVIIRAQDHADFLEHLRGEREWHSLLSRSYQYFSEAKERGDSEAQIRFARTGVMAGEYMRRCGGDFSHHTMQVVEMYGLLGNARAAGRWGKYNHEPNRGLI
jgi:hypothetical protein